MAYKHKIDSTVSIASMISNIERVDMGGQADTQFGSYQHLLLIAKHGGKKLRHTPETRLKNQYDAFSLSEKNT